MPNEEVNVLESLHSEDNPDDEGQSQKAIEEKVRKNLREEYDRKKVEDIEKVKADLASKYESRIAELESKTRLTVKESDELKTLEQKVYEIERNPDAKPWDVHMERIVERKLAEREQAEFDRRHKSDQPKAQAWVEDKAKELKLDSKEFEEELLEIMEDRWLDELPTARVQKAYAQLQKYKSKYSKKEGESMKPEHSEGEGRAVKKVTTQQALDEAKKSGNWSRILAQTAQNQEKDNSRGAGL